MSRNALIISILVGLLVTAAWWFLLVGPQRDRQNQAEEELQAAQDEEFILRTQLSQLQRIQDNELPYRAAIAELETEIPDQPQTASLIDQLAALADETGVLWQSGNYGNPELNEDTGLFEIPLALNVEGQFFEVLGYLYGVADLDRLVRIDGVNISPRQDEAGFTILSVNLTGRAFATGTVQVPLIELEVPDQPAEESTTTTTTTPEDGTGENGALDTGESTTTTTTPEDGTGESGALDTGESTTTTTTPEDGTGESGALDTGGSTTTTTAATSSNSSTDTSAPAGEASAGGRA